MFSPFYRKKVKFFKVQQFELFKTKKLQTKSIGKPKKKTKIIFYVTLLYTLMKKYYKKLIK